MQEPNKTSQVPHPDDLTDIKNSSNDCSCESSREPNNVPMSICFLVREQAKSLVAIQELQKRLSHVENVQVDVIDTLIQFRNYLCEASNSDINVSPSYLIDSKSPITTPSPKSNVTTFHTPFEPRSILKNSSYPTKANENICNEFQRISSIVTIQDQPQKHFDSTKSKESALESDKQDSGLDSDCRDHNEGHQSAKIAPSWVNQETNDQLLQLLDEISCRSEYLQKQLAVVEESTILSDVNEEMIAAAATHPKLSNDNSSSSRSNNGFEATFEVSENSDDKSKMAKSSSADISQDVGVQVLIPAASKYNNSGFAGFLEAKSFCERGSSKRRVGKSIDSTLVSSILKETNAVDLQRQALIYLVDNTVLNTKLRDLEQALVCRNVESDKVENSLKEETRLLMMENRELRICLDEQKREKNILKSRVVMLERVLQSMNVENQELNWQLGESLNLQQFSKKSINNLSSSFASSSPTNFARSVRKSSSLPSPPCRNSSLSCSKSKLLSSTSNFLDATVEESDDGSSVQISRTKWRNGPIQSSTPFQRPLSNVIDSPCSGLPASFHSIKKCLKSGHSFDSDGASFKSAKADRYSGECDIPEGCVKNYQFSHSSSHDALRLPMGNVSKFPFNSILEKLKANSEYRLSRSVPSAKDSEASASASDLEGEQASNASAVQGQPKSQTKDSKSPQVNGKSSVQTRKSRNIHQRIQNILDRIVAESEEAS